MTEYITSAEVERILSLSPRSAMRWLRRQGVNPISLGVGRGLGLRWSRVDVEAAISGATLFQQPKEEKEEKKPRRPPLSKCPLVGRSLKEQLALISDAQLQ